MSAEHVRRLFDVELAQALAESDIGLGFRCRFHVAGAGAWDVSLALLAAGCRDARTASGGYRAVVELDAAEWGSPSARVKITLVDTSPREDLGRAQTMLDVLFRGPPFVWPSSLRVAPVACALLASAPAISAPPPMEPPVPFLETVLGSGQPSWWHEDLVALHDALVPDAPLESEEAFEIVFPEIASSGFDLTLRAVPASLRAALSNASDDVLDAFVANHSRSPRYAAGLRRMRAFARQHAAIFLWGRYD